MKTKHTPGPWHVKENHAAGGLIHLAVLSADEISMPCSVSPMHLRRDVDDANARLIAASPELYEALRMIAVTATEHTDIGIHMSPEAVRSISKWAKVALVKATQSNL